DLVEKLQCKKFCNVFRELDRCSRWVYRWRNLSESCLFLNIYLLRFVAVTDVRFRKLLSFYGNGRQHFWYDRVSSNKLEAAIRKLCVTQTMPSAYRSWGRGVTRAQTATMAVKNLRQVMQKAGLLREKELPAHVAVGHA
ncbi:unnamed protein product, partial [Cladocopium goreaui]